MNRFTFASHFVLIASLYCTVLVGCTAPAHLMHTSEPSQDEKVQQTIAAWRGMHISKAVQKWGAPNEVNDDGTGWQTYIWQVPVHGFLARQEANVPGFQLRQDHQLYPLRRPSGMQGVGGKYLSTDYTYMIAFYARPNGIIYKTLLKKNYDPASELKWK